MTVSVTYAGRGMWIAECDSCPWTYEGPSLADGWVNWRIHDKHTHY